MAERAGIFDNDFDVSDFAPKKPAEKLDPEAVRAVSENANFRSREPVQRKKPDRRHRTGRNEQLNVKVDSKTFRLFYEIYDAHRDQEKWVQGEVIARALAALQRELLDKPRREE